MESDAAKLFIVIVTWNGQGYVRECLNSVVSASEGLAADIIVVDNDSSDGTPEVIAQEFPRVKLIRSDRNLGFAKGNNVGLRLVSPGARYVCLINSDVTLTSGCLRSLVCYMDENASVGLAGPKMLAADGGVRRSTMRFPTLWRVLCRALAIDSLSGGRRVFGDLLMGRFAAAEPTDVDVLNGWFWVVRVEALQDVGPLDERFFMYSEDVDWCRRFHRTGWRVVFYPRAAAVHYGGASSDREPVRFYIQKQVADLQYWRQSHGRGAMACFLLAGWLHHALRLSGYTLLYIFRRSQRRTAAFKLNRSVASLLWLSGLRKAHQ